MDINETGQSRTTVNITGEMDEWQRNYVHDVVQVLLTDEIFINRLAQKVASLLTQQVTRTIKYSPILEIKHHEETE